MTTLPPGWVVAPLGDLVDVLDHMRVPVSAKERAKRPGAVPYYGATGQVGHIDASIFNEDLVLLGEDGVQFFDPNKPKAYRISGPAWVNNHAHVLRAGPGIDWMFLCHYLNHFNYEGSANGTTRLKLTQAAMSRIPVTLPPLAEQHRIVAALEDLLSLADKGRDLLNHTTIRIERFRERIMRMAATGYLDGTPGAQTAPPPEPAGVVDGDLPGLPATWRWCRLGEIADTVGGVTKDSKRQSDPDLVETPYLRVANVQRGFLDLSSIATIRVPANKVEALRLRAGDVLLNEGGDRDKLGRGWVWEGQIDPCLHQNHVFRARVRDNRLHPKLLAWHANSFGRHWFQTNGRQSVNLASISLSKVKLFPVPIPPIEEQGRLVSLAEQYLSLLDKLQAAIEMATARAARLRTSLLTEAFGGRLVAQDPNDEPASELLARITAQRAHTPARGRARTRRTSRSVPRQAPAPSHGASAGTYQEEELPL